ncbi:serine hydrolase domain-containing protein [Spongiactinospora gelatinilytica]|uniref:serine hydrolase domain-containing protein n=1 Tax=Spongiactinospora gelatinilytica TaxID=2666298 RepID=UPI001F44457C|nr:serine hydrolase domain-containing protein [Spongiactinospora gelatinilytica]
MTRVESEELRARLAEHAGRQGLIGAVLAVQHGDETTEAAYGVLDKEFGYPATIDSIFQIGSITKVWTATLIMQLADEGLLDLDTPVAHYLPGFRVTDEAASAAVTVRQLLSHVGGFDGDIFDDYGDGDDAVQRYVDALAGPARQLFPPGSQWSYCNSGCVVLGRIVSVLTGQTWEAAIRERIAAPLGMTYLATSPAEAIRHRVAMGHIEGPGGELVKAPIWGMPRSNAPAGATLTMAARNLLAFARMHQRLGLASDGTRVLSQESAPAMREPQAEVPGDGPLADHWGLGGSCSKPRAGSSSATTAARSGSPRCCAWCPSGTSRSCSSPTAAGSTSCTNSPGCWTSWPGPRCRRSRWARAIPPPTSRYGTRWSAR